MSTFDMVTAEAAYCALGSSTTRVHCIPTTLGIDHRIINGRVYIGGNAVTDPAEIATSATAANKMSFRMVSFRGVGAAAPKWPLRSAIPYKN